MTMIAPPDLRRSVKHFDRQLLDGWSLLNIFGDNGLQPTLLPDLGTLITRGGNVAILDQALRATVQAEGMWASAFNIAVSSVTTLDWELTGDVPLRNKQAREVLEYVPYIKTMELLATDYLGTNNGCFAEILKASNARGSRIIGLDHLDSAYCRRTGDPENPVAYIDTMGIEHLLRYDQVLELVDQPLTSRDALGRGICAAHRAYNYIRKLATIEIYIIEKVGGKRPLAIYLVSNMSNAALASGVATATADLHDLRNPDYAPSAQAFMGALVIPTISDQNVAIAKIDLAGLPDGFNEQSEWSKALLAYAKALGLDPQDVSGPITGVALGTGKQSEVLHNKATGYGIGAFKAKFKAALREKVLPNSVVFTFSENDTARKQAQAALTKTRTEIATAQLAATIITVDQARQMLVDLGDLPEQFLTAPDTTPDLSVASDDARDVGEVHHDEPATT